MRALRIFIAVYSFPFFVPKKFTWHLSPRNHTYKAWSESLKFFSFFDFQSEKKRHRGARAFGLQGRPRQRKGYAIPHRREATDQFEFPVFKFLLLANDAKRGEVSVFLQRENGPKIDSGDNIKIIKDEKFPKINMEINWCNINQN
jgi:hypothetical protein